MNYRKHLLSLAFALLVAFYLGDWALDALYLEPLQRAQRLTGLLNERIELREKELAAARRAGLLLSAWETQSLPSDIEVARSLYQAWLLELVDHVGLAGPSVNSSPPTIQKGGFHTLSFTVAGRGTLEQLTNFLFEFYTGGHLHQIRSIVVRPLSRTDQLELHLTVEAVSLPTADRSDRLVVERSNRLVFYGVQDYRVIMQRDLFSVGGSPNAVEHTRLTGVTSDDGRPVAWFSLQTTGEMRKLRTGEILQVGHFSGNVAQIDGNDVILESDGQRWLLTIGENLSEAAALPPEF
ncbi:MAG: hypothetical protein V3R99_13945 [Thermoguttaceae bacterium]